MKRILPFAKINFNLFLKKNIECNNISYSFLRKNQLLPFYIRQKSIFNIYNIHKLCNISKLLYVCIVTGKARAINTNFRMSNLTFKTLIKKGIFNGFVE